MSDDPSERIGIELTKDEAKLIVTALRQFEPFWPSDMDEMSRAELLAAVRGAIDRVTKSLDTGA